MNYKKILIPTCTVILLPVLVGLLLWNRLPAELAIHFDFSGQPDSFVPRLSAILLIPGILLLLQIVCVLATRGDFSAIHSKWAEKIVYWIIPCCSLIVCGFLYAFNVGIHFNMALWVLTLCSLVMLVLGNLMPKSSMNSFFGARVSWAYKSEAAWKLTQRINGWGMVIGSILTLLLTWTGCETIAIWVLLASILVSLIWSWFACRHLPPESPRPNAG